MNIDLILEGEFAMYPSDDARATRSKYIVQRLATVRSTAAVNQEIAKCKHTAATWRWGDNSTTVVDIRPR